MLNELERAESDLKRAQEIVPEDRMIQNEMQRLEAKKRQSDKQAKKVFQKMFN